MSEEWKVEKGVQSSFEDVVVVCVHETVIIGILDEWRVENGNRRAILSRS
jgi:hypothetical protein